MTPGEGDKVAQAIERFTPRSVSADVARLAKELTRAAVPETPARAKAFLFAACRLAAFAELVGLELSPEVVVVPSVIERCCHPATTAMSAATARTVRTNLRALARARRLGPPPLTLSRERAKPPYTPAEIAAYLALANAQPTTGRRMRAGALICLGAGAGLVGTDIKAVRGTHVVARSGGVVVEVGGRRAPRTVPVLLRYHERLLECAAFAAHTLLIGGTSPVRRNVTTPLTASLSGGADLARLEVSRLRATWLCEVAQAIGLKGFMDAAGIVCSQRLGDLLVHLEALSEPRAVALLGGR